MRRAGIGGIRSSFALRTMVAGVLLALGLAVMASVAVVATHRQQQLDEVDQTSSTRAAMVQQLLGQVSVAEASATARDLAVRQSLGDLLAAHAGAYQVGSLLAGTRAPAGIDLYVIDATATVTPVPGSDAWPAGAAATAAVRPALAGSEVATPAIVDVHGRLAALVAAPVVSGGGSVGAVAAVMPLPGQLQRFAAAVGYPVVLVAPGSGVQPVAVASSRAPADAPALVGDLLSLSGQSLGEVRATRSDGGQATVVDLVRLPSAPAASGSVLAYVGVAVPVSGFFATEGSTIVTVALVALLAATITSLAILVIVDRWVRRPIAELEQGVTRIAAGDYGVEVPVHATDELGRLAGSVNRMSGQIATAMAGTRAALDDLRWVSEALTALDHGAAEQSAAIARAAAAIAGEGSGACLVHRHDGGSTLTTHGDPGDIAVERAAAERGDHGVLTRQAGDGTWRTSFSLSIDEGVVTGRLVVSSAAPLGDNELSALGTLASYAGLALDHTRLLEQEQETVRRLRAADSARTEFLSTTHHELRTPLSIVLGMAELTESSWDAVDDAARRHHVSSIVDGARRLARTIENVLTMTMLASEEVPLSRRPVQLGPLVRRVTAAAQQRWAVEGPRSVQVDVADDVAVDADADFFERMLDAVVDNAVKFTPAGGSVQVRAERDDDAVVLRVIDGGVGVPSAALPHVFDRFYQAEQGHAREFGGLGLGLTIAARICTLHGAAISVAAVEPHGTEVTVHWPAADPPAGTADQALTTSASTTSG